MPQFELQKAGKTEIKKASREAIADYFVALPAHERKGKWLRKNNPYRINCIKTYEGAVRAVPPALDHERMVDYIAASGPTHAIDGWGFLGRAVHALLRHDAYGAIHFAYYAELRAAMSLLASEGVCILNSRHPIVTARNKTTHLPKCTDKRAGSKKWARTHAVVVPTLRYWSSLKRASELLDQIVQPGDYALSAWLDASGAYARSQAVAYRWLKAWGLDLAQIDTDHDARNLVSYRPCEFRRPTVAGIDQLATFARDLWCLFEPSANFRFPSLEIRLLRLALDECGVSPPDASTIESLGFSSTEARTLASALSRNDTSVPLDEAKEISQIESERCPMQVISRAALLLFIATRSASLHLSNAGYTRDDLAFWWKRFGVERGLWGIGSEPEDPRDAWADIKDSLHNIEESLNEGGVSSLADWRDRLLKTDRTLGDYEAWEFVAVWGLVP